MTYRRAQFVDIAITEGFIISRVETRSKHDFIIAILPNGRCLRQLLSKGRTSERSRTVDNFKASLRRFKKTEGNTLANAHLEAAS